MVSTSRRVGRLICTPSEMHNFLGDGLIFGSLLVLGVPLFVDGGRLGGLPRRSRQCRRRQRPTA